MPRPAPISSHVRRVVGDLTGFVRKAAATGNNVKEYILTGGLVIEEQSSPYEVVASGRIYRLRRYFPADRHEELAPLVLIPPLLIVCDVYDVAPRSSVVGATHAHGMDPWIIDFGRPEDEPDGLQRTIEDHVLAVDEVIDHVRRITGKDPILAGYSQGGLFAYQAAAYRRGEGVDSIVALGTPVDFTQGALPTPVAPVSAASYMQIAEALVAVGVLPRLALPRWLGRAATRMTDPASSLKFQLQYIGKLHDRESLLPGEQQRQFLDRKGFTVYPGPALEDLFRLVAENRALSGGLVFGDRSVSLADITCPILTIVGERDREGAAPSVRAIDRAAPLAPIYELTLSTGHFGMVASSAASRNTWPRVAAWARWRAGLEELPEVIGPAEEVQSTKVWAPTRRGQQLQAVADLGVDASRVGLTIAATVGSRAWEAVRDGGRQVPVLNKAELLQPPRPATLGSLVGERAQRSPRRVALVDEGVVTTYEELDRAVEELVAQLLAADVRRGDRVGIGGHGRVATIQLMVALSRIGAVAVVLRADRDIEAQIAIGRVDVVTLAGTSAAVAPGSLSRPSLMLKAAAGRRRPDWFVPNPPASNEPVLVSFVGNGDTLRAHELSGAAWRSLSQFLVEAWELGRSSTVALAAPAGHPTTVTAVSAGLVAGARIAPVRRSGATELWVDARRAGVSHLACDEPSIRALLAAAPSAREHGNTVRAVGGTDLPRYLHERILARFPDVTVFEFYAACASAAKVVSSEAAKRGLRSEVPKRGPDVRVVEYDFVAQRIVADPHGFARPTRPGMMGVLVSRATADDPVAAQALRGIFAANDAWVDSGDAFVRERDGSLVFAGPARGIVVAPAGPLSPVLVASALGRLSRVDSVEARVVDRAGCPQIHATVWTHPGADLSSWDLMDAASSLDTAQRPAVVDVVSAQAGDTQADAHRTEPDVTTWELSDDAGSYRRREDN